MNHDLCRWLIVAALLCGPAVHALARSDRLGHELRQQWRRPVVAQATRVDGGWYEAVAQRVHFDKWRQAYRVAEVEGVRAAGQARTRLGFDRNNARLAALPQLLSDERKRQPGEVVQGGVAGLADHRRHDRVPAVVLQHQWRAGVAGQVLVAPAHQRRDHRIQVTAGVGEPVLVPGRVLAVLPPLQDPRGDQRAQPGRQRVARRSGAPDHLVELAVAEEDLAHGEQRPLLPDDVERARH